MNKQTQSEAIWVVLVGLLILVLVGLLILVGIGVAMSIIPSRSLRDNEMGLIYVRNPVDLSNNISVGLGQSVNFDLLYSLNSSGISNPIIIVDVNQTSVNDVTIDGLSKVTCPTMITTNAGRKNICFQDVNLTSAEGIRIRKVNLLFSGSVAPSTDDSLTISFM